MLSNGTWNAWRTIRCAIVAASLAGLMSSPAQARTDPDPDQAEPQVAEEELVDVEYETIRIGGTFEFPWSIAFLPDRSLLLTERVGRLQHIRPDGTAREVEGLPPMFNGGLAGLLDVAVDPDFT